MQYNFDYPLKGIDSKNGTDGTKGLQEPGYLQTDFGRIPDALGNTTKSTE